MSVTNLAVVFAPTLMRPSDPARELSDVKLQQGVIIALLENYMTIFGNTGNAGTTGTAGSNGNSGNASNAGNTGHPNNAVNAGNNGNGH